jgi:hypothetical protein
MNILLQAEKKPEGTVQTNIFQDRNKNGQEVFDDLVKDYLSILRPATPNEGAKEIGFWGSFNKELEKNDVVVTPFKTDSSDEFIREMADSQNSNGQIGGGQKIFFRTQKEFRSRNEIKILGDKKTKRAGVKANSLNDKDLQVGLRAGEDTDEKLYRDTKGRCFYRDSSVVERKGDGKKVLSAQRSARLKERILEKQKFDNDMVLESK